MTSSALFLLLLLLIVPLRLLTATPVIFDHYVLALTWPNSYCRIEQCLHPDQKNLPQVFTIHGLWPTLSNGGSPTNCSTEAFNFKLMGTLTKKAATQKWPDIRYSFQRKTKAIDSKEFWTGQWIKHGACSNLGPDNYMDVAMKLYDKVSTGIDSAMKSHPPGGTVNILEFWTGQWIKHGACSNLGPDNYMDVAMKLYNKVSTGIDSAMKSHPPGGTVNILEFTADIEKLVRKKPRLVCPSPNIVNPKGQLLSEIQFHVDKSGEFIDAGNSNCDPSIEVQFP